MEYFQSGKQIGKIFDIKSKQTRHRAPQLILLGLESEKNMDTGFHIFEFFEKYLKFAHGCSVQNGYDAFPNELMRFRIEATPIWDKIQKHFKNES